MTVMSRRLEKILFMNLWNADGALVSLNGMTIHSKDP